MGQELATSCWSRELATQLFPILLSSLLDEEKLGQALVLIKIALSLKQTKLIIELLNLPWKSDTSCRKLDKREFCSYSSSVVFVEGKIKNRGSEEKERPIFSYRSNTRNDGSVQFNSVVQSCLTLCDLMDWMPDLPVHRQRPASTQTHVHWVGDAIQPSHPLSFPPPIFDLSQHQGLFKWLSSSHQVAKVLEFQLQHQSFQWTIQDWSPLGWTGWISLLSKGLSRVFSKTTVQKHQFVSIQLSL